MHELIPSVRNIIRHRGAVDLAGGFAPVAGKPFASLVRFVRAYFPADGTTRPVPLVFAADASLSPEGYRLAVDAAGVRVSAAGRKGAFYALQTLRQLAAGTPKQLPRVSVDDAPDLPLRGFMMDISRDKIPTMATVKRFVDTMAMVKMNHFELYVEGFSYAYPSFPETWKDETPFTPAEYRELDRYCAAREIDFVPCQNGFGHMSAWLARPEFKRLAECEEGFEQWGFPFPPSTLNPLDPDSFDLVRKMYGDMLPQCRSPYFNLCGDEPFELGRGKSAAACARRGREAVYVEFITELCAEARRHGKTPMMWGDVLVNRPETVGTLPAGSVFIDWGYDRDYPFAAHAAMLAGAGVDFVLAPGTSSWNSFASRRKDMLETTRNAADGAKRHGGRGILQTDWGDFGHLQYLPFSWPGLLEAAGASWGRAPAEEDVVRFIDCALAPEGDGRFGRCLVDLATYQEREKAFVYNATTAFKPILYADPTPGRDVAVKRAILAGALGRDAYGVEAAAAVSALCDAVRKSAARAKPSLVQREILATCAFVEAGVAAHRTFTEPAVADAAATRAITLLSWLIPEHARLWMKRNRKGGLSRSLARPIALKSILEASRTER